MIAREMASESVTRIYVTVAEAKRRTGIDRPLEAAIRSGEIRVIRAGAWRRVRFEDVIQHFERRGDDGRHGE